MKAAASAIFKQKLSSFHVIQRHFHCCHTLPLHLHGLGLGGLQVLHKVEAYIMTTYCTGFLPWFFPGLQQLLLFICLPRAVGCLLLQVRGLGLEGDSAAEEVQLVCLRERPASGSQLLTGTRPSALVSLAALAESCDWVADNLAHMAAQTGPGGWCRPGGNSY